MLYVVENSNVPPTPPNSSLTLATSLVCGMREQKETVIIEDNETEKEKLRKEKNLMKRKCVGSVECLIAQN